MKPPPLSWICSFLSLCSVASSAAQLTFTELPNETQHAVLLSEHVDFCEYVLSVAEGVITPTSSEIESVMLAKIAEEERHLDLDNGPQCIRKQRILKSVRTFTRLHSELPSSWEAISTEEFGRWAKVFESSYEDCAFFSESPTWKKACMAGLFGHNTLNTLLPYLSDEFRFGTKNILLETAFFIGDIDSLKAIVDSFEIPNEEVLAKVPERDIVFSGSVDFFSALLERLPNVMEKRWSLMEEASSLKRFNILTRLLEEVDRVKQDELKSILDSFLQFKMYNDDSIASLSNVQDKLYFVLEAAAQHGHLPIIRFLWPAMDVMVYDAQDKTKAAIKDMMIEAGSNNHRSVLEFLLWQSGALYTQIAQEYVNDAFEAAVVNGHVAIMELLTGKDNDGKPVIPGLSLTELDGSALYEAICENENWEGIARLVRLKEEGDPRFAGFELVDQDNSVLRIACETGNYDLVDYLFRKYPNGELVFPLTNPAVGNSQPLVNACWSGNLRIVEKLLERDVSGNYIYKGIDPSAQRYQSIYTACRRGYLPVVKFLLNMKDGKYVVPGMNGVDFSSVLSAAINWNQEGIVKWLLRMNKVGEYVLPGMYGVDLIQALWDAIRQDDTKVVSVLLKMENGKYVLPGMNGVDLTLVLSAAIEGHRKRIVKWLLRMNKVGEYVLPGMSGVDLTRALSTAIKWSWNDRGLDIVNFLLSKSPDGSYWLSGIKVTEDMLRISNQSPKLRELLERHL